MKSICRLGFHCEHDLSGQARLLSSLFLSTGKARRGEASMFWAPKDMAHTSLAGIHTHPPPSCESAWLHTQVLQVGSTPPQAPHFPHHPEGRQWEGGEYAPGVRTAAPAWGHKKKYKILRNNFQLLSPLQQSIPTRFTVNTEVYCAF